MARPEISLVTPSFNQAQFLESTLCSVLDQSYPSLEYIVVDGASTDGSVDIIRRHSTYLTHWESTPDRGQVHALNKGFARATGEIFGWVNSDDILLPGTLDRVAEYLSDPNVDLVYGQRKLIDDQGRVIQDVVLPRCNPLHFMVYSLGALNQEATFWRAALHHKVGELDEAYDQAFDYEYIIRLCEHAQGRWRYAPEFFGGCRYHADQKAVRYDAQGRRVAYVASLEIRDAYLRRHHISPLVFWPRHIYYRLLRRASFKPLPWPRTRADLPAWRRARELLR